MRKLIALSFAIIVSYSVFAQYGELPRTKVEWNGIKLEDNKVIGVSFEIQDATFGGLSYEDRCDIDPELKTDFHDVVARCVNSANHEMDKYTYRNFFSTNTEGKEYVLVFIVHSISSDGWVDADAKLLTPTGVATFTDLTGKGGIYGSFVNLMGDGFESLGKDVAKRIAKARARKKI